MKKIFKFSALLALCVAISSAVSCQKNDLDTNQFTGGPIVFSAMSPNPVVRGAQLRIVGANLEKVVKVEIPGADPVTAIKVNKSGAKSEIEITVPAYGPYEGKVVLYDASGNKASSTFNLTYDESDFQFSGFEAAAVVMPGDVITVKGEFINTMAEVIFCDGVYVTSEGIYDATRESAKVIVPDHAVTGPIQIGNADEVANPAAVAVVFQSDKDLVVGDPTVQDMGTLDAKAGDVLTFKGKYLKMIKSVTFQNASSEEVSTNDDGTELYVALPAEALSGEVSLVSYAGNNFPAGSVETVLPNNLKIKAEKRYKAGLNAIITADNLDLVTGVTFGGVAADISWEELDGGSCIVAVIPETAPDGDVLVSLANGTEVLVASLELVKPSDVEMSVSEIVARETFNLSGEDLDLITGISIGGIDCTLIPVIEKIEEGEDEFGDPVLDTLYSTTSLDVETAPTILSGDVVIALANGYTETVGTMAVSYDEPISLEYKKASIQLGQNLEITGTNLFQIAKIYVKGKLVTSFSKRTDTEISFALPDGVGPGVYRLDIVLIDDTELTWAIPFEYTAPYTEKFIWEGSLYLNSWGTQEYLGAEGAFADLGAVEGDIVRIYFTPEKDDWVFQLYDGHWNGLSVAELDGGNQVDASVYGGEGYFAFELTAGLLEQLNSIQYWGGQFVTNGDGVTYTGISLIHWGASETVTTIWEGSVSMGVWANSMSSLSWGGYDWSTVSAGTILRVEFSCDASGADMRFGNGSWSALPSTIQYAKDADGNIVVDGLSKFEFELTQADLDQLVNNGGLVMCGCNYTITSVSLVESSTPAAIETTIWEGSADLAGWSINWQIGDGTFGADNPNVFVDAGLTEGKEIRIYGEFADWWQVQFFNGHWEGQTEIGTATGLENGNNINSGIYDISEKGYISIPVTETIATHLTTLIDWGYCWILQGEGAVLTKITVI